MCLHFFLHNWTPCSFLGYYLHPSMQFERNSLDVISSFLSSQSFGWLFGSSWPESTTDMTVEGFPPWMLGLAQETNIFSTKHFILRKLFLHLQPGMYNRRLIQNDYRPKLKLISKWPFLSFFFFFDGQLHLPVNYRAKAAHTYNTDICTYAHAHMYMYMVCSFLPLNIEAKQNFSTKFSSKTHCKRKLSII